MAKQQPKNGYNPRKLYRKLAADKKIQDNTLDDIQPMAPVEETVSVFKPLTAEQKAMIQEAKKQIDYALAESFVREEDYPREDEELSSKKLSEEERKLVYGHNYDKLVEEREKEANRRKYRELFDFYDKTPVGGDPDVVEQEDPKPKITQMQDNNIGEFVAESDAEDDIVVAEISPVIKTPQVYISNDNVNIKKAHSTIINRLEYNVPSNPRASIHNTPIGDMVKVFDIVTGTRDVEECQRMTGLSRDEIIQYMDFAEESYTEIFTHIREHRSLYMSDDNTFDMLRARVVSDINKGKTFNQYDKNSDFSLSDKYSNAELATAVVTSCSVSFLNWAYKSRKDWANIIDAVYNPTIPIKYLETESRNGRVNKAYEFINGDFIVTVSADDSTMLAVYTPDYDNIMRAIRVRSDDPESQSMLKSQFGEIIRAHNEARKDEYMLGKRMVYSSSSNNNNGYYSRLDNEQRVGGAKDPSQFDD